MFVFMIMLVVENFPEISREYFPSFLLFLFPLLSFPSTSLLPFLPSSLLPSYSSFIPSLLPHPCFIYLKSYMSTSSTTSNYISFMVVEIGSKNTLLEKSLHVLVLYNTPCHFLISTYCFSLEGSLEVS